MHKHHHHHHHYGRDRDGYAHRAGAPGPGPNPHRLARNIRDGKVAGVCAGVADYFGWSRKWTRIGMVLSVPFTSGTSIAIYVAAAFLLPAGQGASPRFTDPEEERFWRTYSVKPKATMSELKHRFRALDARIGDMEKAVTANEFTLRREFRDLERGH